MSQLASESPVFSSFSDSPPQVIEQSLFLLSVAQCQSCCCCWDKFYFIFFKKYEKNYKITFLDISDVINGANFGTSVTSTFCKNC